MEETEKENVNTQENVEPENTQPSETQPENVDNTENPPRGSKEYNWRQMEEKNKQLQHKVWELEQKDKSQTATQQEKEKLSEEEDDIPTKKEARAIFQEEIQKAERAKQPLAAKQNHSDFTQVVSNENIEKLKQEDPEIESLIMLSQNPYERLYKEIKKAEFYKSQNLTKESEERIAENSKKPISSNSIGKQRPLSYANDYAKGDPNLWKEMSKFRGGSL